MTFALHNPADPSRIVEIATGYMAAQQLFAASRKGLFAALSAKALDVPALAAATGLSERMTRILADAMAGLGLLTRGNGKYGLTAESSAYLAGDKAALDLGPFLVFLEEISYPHWLQFARTVETDKPGDLGMTEARWKTFLDGVMTYNRLHAAQFVEAIDLSGARRLLDLGGLAPYFAIGAMELNPDLRTTFAYAPDFTDSLAAELERAGFSARAEILAAPTPEATATGPFDVIFLNHVVHRFNVAENRQIIGNARKAAEKGTRLALLDFFLDDNSEQRAIDALHAGEYLVIDGTVVYPESEVRGWLEEAGWRQVGMVSLPGSPRVLLAEAV